jgi:hypothetical protein
VTVGRDRLPFVLRPSSVVGRLKRRALARLHQVAQNSADRQRTTGLRPIRRNPQNAMLKRLDLVGRLVALDQEQQIARLHSIAILLEPLEKHTLFHCPAKPG